MSEHAASGFEVLTLDAIRVDGGTQSRAGLDDRLVEEYVALIKDGGAMDAVQVFFDGTDRWLVDGFHRVAAYRRSGRAVIRAVVHHGTLDEARWYASSVEVNGKHGKRRTREDAQHAIKMALANPAAVGKSDREIAKHCGVHHETVGAARARLESVGEIRQLNDRTGADGKTYNANKNRKPRVERDPEPVVDEPAVEATPEVFDAPAPDDVPAFVVDEPVVTEPEPPPAVVAAPPAPVRIAPIDPPVAVVVPLVAVAPAPTVSVPTHDARGTEIPEALRATYAAMTRRAERIARAAEALRAEFDELKNDLPAWRADTARNAIATPGLPGLAHCFSQDFPALLYAARQFAPQYLCEDCSGRDPACKHCEGAGWEPEGRVRERLRQQKAVATARAKAGVR